MEQLLLLNNNVKLSKPPLILPPPPPPPYALNLSPARSAFSYLFLKQSAFNSYTYFLRNFIDQFSDNNKNNNNINNNINIQTKQKNRQVCKQIDISSLDYLINYELNKIQHLNSLESNKFINKTKNRFNSEINSHYLLQQTNFNNNNSNSKGMYEIIEPKNSFQFLFNILIVPIIFFTIFIVIIIVTMISKL